MPNRAGNQDLILSVDSKPRLKWTPQLHECFVDAVSQLGGIDNATPKAVMRAMGIPGLTLYHLKSHLQKYRLAKNRDLNATHDNIKQDCSLSDNSTIDNGTAAINLDQRETCFDISMLQIQMDVQRKLQEQLKVQKHLQLRIEAQGKYLQSVLRKAQETLTGYSLNSMGAEEAKVELSELVCVVDTEFTGRSFNRKQTEQGDCSTDSCLTSLEGLQVREGKRRKLETSPSSKNKSGESDGFDPTSGRTTGPRSSDQAIIGRKRSCSSFYVEACVEHQSERSLGLQKEFDLNT